MESQKKTRERRSYEPDFKAEILKMLFSGKKVSEIAETFGIAENMDRHSGMYRWKTLSTMKTKAAAATVKANESEGSSKLATENAKLKAEIERLKTDREILKKASGLLSSSN